MKLGCSKEAYAPFGEPYNESDRHDRSFTGQDQDTVGAGTGLYDFLYRRYHPVQGRWISPDPAGLAAVDPANPQTWNRYAYVGNDVLRNIDPLGLDNDCGGPCTPFLYRDGNCTVDVTYYKVKGKDGNIYDQPLFDTNCPQTGMIHRPVTLYITLAQWDDTHPSRLVQAANNEETANELKRINQQCLDNFNNSATGKFTNFFSLASPIIGPDRLQSTIEVCHRNIVSCGRTAPLKPNEGLNGASGGAIHVLSRSESHVCPRS